MNGKISLLFILTFILFILSIDNLAQDNKRTEKHLTQPKKYLSSLLYGSNDTITETPPYCISPIHRIKKPRQLSLAPFSVNDDTTAPFPPSNLQVTSESIYNIIATWDTASDPESGISNYVFGVGSSPGEADIRWWQVSSTNITGLYTQDLNLNVGDTIYVSVYAKNNANLNSSVVSSNAIVIKWDNLGASTNNITYSFSGGWLQSEKDTMQLFLDKMIPILKSVYGPPSHSYNVTLVKDSLYSNTNIFFASIDQIHMLKMSPQLLTHEMIHAFHENVVIASDSLWRYSPVLSGFEESFAQGISYFCMNKYVQMYPNDPIVPSSSLFGSFYEWDYDFQNTDIITTTDFWSDQSGTLIYWLRYEMGAAAIEKIMNEYPNFAKDFNSTYYQMLNTNHELYPTRTLIRDIIASVIPTIEGKDASSWIDKQHIFDCKIKTGRKIYPRTQDYPGWTEGYVIFHNVYYYETFSNGSEWAYWDNATSSYKYYYLNGSLGNAALSDWNGNILESKNIQIKPTDNVPVIYSFGKAPLTMETSDDNNPWPGGDKNDFFLGLHKFELYWLDITFDSISVHLPRVMGDTLINTRGIMGAVLNSDGGKIYIDHDGYSPEKQLDVSNGVFWGLRSWASIPNANTGWLDSKPGKVTIRFEDNNGKVYKDYRTIDYGSWSGNQLFLFNTNQMQLVGNYPVISSNLTDIDFETVRTDSPKIKSIYITDTSTDTLKIDSIYTKTKYFVPQITNGIISIIDTLKIGVLFCPDSSITYNDTLYIANNSLTSLFKVSLHGKGEMVTNVKNNNNIIPSIYSISQNYPNPFNPSTIINYSLPFESDVTIVVYNILGEEVIKLVEGNKPAGIHKVNFDGSGLSSGIYFYALRATSSENNKNFLKVKKMVLLK